MKKIENAKKINKFLDKNEGLTELDATKQLGINPDKLDLYKNMKTDKKYTLKELGL